MKKTGIRRMVGAGLAFTAGVIALSVTTPAAQADVVPTHAINICQSASFYENFDHATNAPSHYLYTLPYGQKVGHTDGAQPVYEGWAATFDFQTQSWGYMEYDCIGGYNSW